MTSRRSQKERAEAFCALHHAQHILLLPNAWDVVSARAFEEGGFPAVATSSAAVAASLGYPDGEKIPKDELFAVVKRIVRTVGIPVSVDMESGYGTDLVELEDTVRRLLDAGAVGLNLEDTSRSRGRGLIPISRQAERLRTVRRVSDSVGVPLVINARTDALQAGGKDDAARRREAIARLRAYEAAGSDCLYPMGLADPKSIVSFVKAVHAPLNVMVRKGLPSIRELERLGIRRLSLGPTAMYATVGLLRRISSDLRVRGTYDALLSDSVSFDELMALAVPKAI